MPRTKKPTVAELLAQNQAECTKREPKFSTVAVWHNTLLAKEQVADFVAFIKDGLNSRIQFLETIWTKPDLDEQGDPVPKTGGGSDLFFAVHDEDVSKFSTQRFKYSDMRWLTDVIAPVNGGNTRYPERVREYLK